MNLDLADLRTFLAVADLDSFKAGADGLHLSQSALSRRGDKLEDAVGVLLARPTRKVELTTVGRSFVSKACNVLNALERALLGIRDVAERISGEVTLACVPSAGFTKVQFTFKSPECRLSARCKGAIVDKSLYQFSGRLIQSPVVLGLMGSGLPHAANPY